MTNNDDGDNEDFHDVDSKSESENELRGVPREFFRISPALLEHLRASNKAVEAFQEQINSKSEAITRAVQDAAKVDPKILESLTAVVTRNDVLTQWVKEIGTSQSLALTQQFKGMEKFLAGLQELQEQTRKFAESLPNIDATGLHHLRDAYPPNWSRLVNFQIAEEVLYKDGIPVMWVPQSQILDKVLQAPDRESRMTILMEAQLLIVEDCERIINECVHPDLTGQRPLAIAVVRAWKDHPEASQALAVNLTDSLIKRFPREFLPKKRYDDIKDEVKRDLGEVLLIQVRVWFSLAAIYVFFTTYSVGSDDPLPKELSRHVSIHAAHIDHFHRENALIAVMLMTSIMRTFQDVS